jgi:hypothetical protein
VLTEQAASRDVSEVGAITNKGIGRKQRAVALGVTLSWNHRGISVKYLLLIFTALNLGGCAMYQSFQYPDYVESVGENYAVIKPNAKLKGMFLSGRKTVLSLFSGCYMKDDKSENVLGSINVPEAEFGTKEVKVPTGQTLYLKYGTLDQNWNCNSTMSFTPEEGKTYLIDYKMVFAGCKINLTTLDGSDILDLVSYDSYGDSTRWRKCE